MVAQLEPTSGPVGETAIAFARSLLIIGIETVIAFVGAKWVFLVQFFSCRSDAGFNSLLFKGARSGVVHLSLLLREKEVLARCGLMY